MSGLFSSRRKVFDIKMVSMDVSRGFATLVACLFTLFTLETDAKVNEVTNQNFEKFIKGKFFTLTFVDSPSCTRCRLLYPFFVQAAQVFHNDPEIFLARTHDKKLVKDWNVEELPALVYHLHGKKDPHPLSVDVTVDDIVDMIARLLHGNFAGLKRRYTVDLTQENYQEIVKTPRQSVMLLIHSKKKGDKELKNMEKVAYNFRKDDAIVFVTLNVDKQEKLRDESFKTRDVPVLMWFEADKKDKPKRFGSMLSVEMITMFVNEKTGLNRDTEGGILDKAGRVDAADELIEKNVDVVASPDSKKLAKLARDLSTLKADHESHHVDMIDYYIFVIDNIAMSNNAAMLRELLNGEENKLYGMEELPTKEKESIKRRRNILRYFLKLVKDFKENKGKFASDEEEELVVMPGSRKPKGKARPKKGHDAQEL